MVDIISDRRITRKKIGENLEHIHHNIKDAYQFFQKNYQRFNYFRNFTFNSSLSAEDITVLQLQKKPNLEFNICEAYLSRLRGEFAKQEPSLTCRASDDSMNVDLNLLNFLESHIRSIIFDSNMDNMEYDVYTDILSGGFSAINVSTEYANPMSMNQVIKIARCFDPTLVGFDKLARKSHKGDGNYCFELFPMSRREFESKYGTKYTENMSFVRHVADNAMGPFSWSYSTDDKEIVLLGSYYEKKKKKEKIVQLITGEVMTVKEYEQKVEEWNQMNFMQAPTIIGNSRETELETICRYIVIENAVLEYNETDFKYFPLIFVDGNSIMIRGVDNGSVSQLTRPYIYHCEGTQKLKNYAGCSLANELENMVQHKWIIQEEAILPQYKDALINNQVPNVIVYKGFKDNNPSVPLNGPQPVQRIGCPPELIQTFTMADQMMQAILGSYDAALGINNNELSGKAIIAGATLSNATAMPYIVGYLKALNRAGELIVDLIPKYYKNPRSLPTRSMNGKTEYMTVNTPGSLQMNFNPNWIEIKVEAGVNFEIQKSQALDMMERLMKTSPVMNAFMSEEKEGLETLLDNVDIRGIDALKQGVSAYCDKIQQQKQQMAQMQTQMNPMAIKQQELQMKAQQNQMQNQVETAKVAVDKQDSDTERMLALHQIGLGEDSHELTRSKIDAENARTAVEMAVKMEDVKHKHAMDLLGLHHENERHRANLDSKGNAPV